MVNTDVRVLESRTRDRVLRVVSQEGPVSITILVERLGLTETAVRRQVDALHPVACSRLEGGAVGINHTPMLGNCSEPVQARVS